MSRTYSYSLYFVLLCVYFRLPAKMLNFIFIEFTWELGYLRRLNFTQGKWLRGHTSCLHAKWLFFSGWGDKRFLRNHDHDDKVSRLSAIFMNYSTQLKIKNHTDRQAGRQTDMHACMHIYSYKYTYMYHWHCFQNRHRFRHPCSLTSFFLRVKLWKVVMKFKCVMVGSQEI